MGQARPPPDSGSKPDCISECLRPETGQQTIQTPRDESGRLVRSRMRAPTEPIRPTRRRKKPWGADNRRDGPAPFSPGEGHTTGSSPSFRLLQRGQSFHRGHGETIKRVFSPQFVRLQASYIFSPSSPNLSIDLILVRSNTLCPRVTKNEQIYRLQMVLPERRTRKQQWHITRWSSKSQSISKSIKGVNVSLNDRIVRKFFLFQTIVPHFYFPACEFEIEYYTFTYGAREYRGVRKIS